MSSVIAQESKIIKILALGDSYTIGQSVEINKRWPNQLVDSLASKDIKAQVKIIAQTGWTTTELERAISASSLETPYDVVTLLIGVNDQFRRGSIEDYERDFARILKVSISYVGNNTNKVVVFSIPDYGVTPFARQFNPEAISKEIAVFNAVNQRISKNLGVHYVDITPISKQAETYKALLAFDGLHPSAEMYELWVEEMMPLVRDIVEKD